MSDLEKSCSSLAAHSSLLMTNEAGAGGNFFSASVVASDHEL